MDADGRREVARLAGGELEGVPEGAGGTPQADEHHPPHPGSAGALDHAVEVALVVLEVEVGVAVDEARHGHLTRVPAGMPLPIVTTCRSGESPAASSMPCEVIPRSGRGARFATTMMRRPRSAAGSG